MDTIVCEANTPRVCLDEGPEGRAAYQFYECALEDRLEIAALSCEVDYQECFVIFVSRYLRWYFVSRGPAFEDP